MNNGFDDESAAADEPTHGVVEVENIEWTI